MEIPTRYKISLQSFNDEGVGLKNRVYTICTCLDERKTLVLATLAFKQDHPNERIYQVLEMEKLEGDKPLPTDINDRMEW